MYSINDDFMLLSGPLTFCLYILYIDTQIHSLAALSVVPHNLQNE